MHVELAEQNEFPLWIDESRTVSVGGGWPGNAWYSYKTVNPALRLIITPKERSKRELCTSYSTLTKALEKEKLKLNVFRCLRKHIIISFKNNKLYLCLFFRQTPIVRSYIAINQKADKVIRWLIHRFCGPFKTCYRSNFRAGQGRINRNYVWVVCFDV